MSQSTKSGCRKLGALCGLAAGLVLATAASAQDQDILKPQDAYHYVAADAGDAIEVDWALENGYYLYRNKLSFASRTPGVELETYRLPEGLQHEDEFFGVQQIYRDHFFVRLPYTVHGERPAAVDLELKLQGCADLGICYPPQTWTARVELAAAAGGKLDLGSTLGRKIPGTEDFLPVDEVFQPVLTALDGNTVEVAIRVLPGYYLYRDKIAVQTPSADVRLGRLELPAGEPKTDEWFGDMEVYHKDVFGRLSLARATPDAMRLPLEVSYQGCADGGICYPPVHKTLLVDLPATAATSARADVAGGAAAPVSEQARLAALIGSANIGLVVLTFFGAGLLLAFTPCVLPMVPILSGIIAGEGHDAGPARGFILALTYVMGMALVYTLAGIAAAAVGVQLQAIFNQPWVLGLFAALFVVLALGMFGLFELQMPNAVQSRLAAISGRQRSGTVIGAFVMGALSSLIVTACVAPPLVATLTVIGQSGDMLRGGTALFALSLGMGAPLLLVGASAGKLLPRAGAWMVAVRNAFGFVMLGLAIWMLSRILPGTLTLAMWAVLIFMAGVFLGGLTTLTGESSATQKLGKGFGLLAILYAAVLLLGSLAGGDSLLQPLSGLGIGDRDSADTPRESRFVRVKTVDDLDRELASAAASGHPAMLDFYADWCVSCIEMERYTFPDPEVTAALADAVLLQADVTANDAADQALLKRFGIYGPPTIVFFGRDGAQRHGYEVVGYMKAPQFAAHVRRALGATGGMTAQQR